MTTTSDVHEHLSIYLVLSFCSSELCSFLYTDLVHILIDLFIPKNFFGGGCADINGIVRLISTFTS